MGSGPDAPSDAHRARIAIGFRATLQSLGWIGVEAGIFRRLGLDASLPEHPLAATLSPARIADTSFLDELERAEFVKRLYVD